MSKIISFFKSDKFKRKVFPEVKRSTAVIVFTFVYGIGFVWFIEASVIPLYAGGVPGIGQLIRDIFMYHNIGDFDWDRYSGLFLSLFTFVGNIPIILLGWFGVSKKFTIYSLLSVIIQSTVIGFIPPIDLGLSGINHTLVNAIMGGALIGIGVGGCLKVGGSTGGLDIIGQYFALRNGKTVGFLSMVMNVSIAILGGIIVNGVVVDGVTLFGGVIAAYTIIRIVISMILTDRIHTAYQYLSVEIITSDSANLVDEILTNLYRGVTISNVYGAFSHNPKSMIVCVIATYELPVLQEIIRRSDQKAFVVVKPVKTVMGNFTRKTIT